MLRIIAVLLLMTGAAFADAKKDAFQAVAVHLATAYHCMAVTDDEDQYSRAIDASLMRLLEAGYSDDEALDQIAAIQSSLDAHQPTTLTPEFCVDMLDLLER